MGTVNNLSDSNIQSNLGSPLGSPEQQFINQILPGVLEHNSVDRVVENIAKNPNSFGADIANQQAEVKHIAHEYSVLNGGKAPDPLTNKDYESISIIEPPHLYDGPLALVSPNGDSAHRSQWRTDAQVGERALLNYEIQAEWQKDQDRAPLLQTNSAQGHHTAGAPAQAHPSGPAKPANLPDHVARQAVTINNTKICFEGSDCGHDDVRAQAVSTGSINPSVVVNPGQSQIPHK